MTRTITRPRSTARVAALGALTLALAAGCGGTGQGESGTAPADEPSTAQEGGDSSDAAPTDAAPADEDTADEDTTDDGATDDGATEDGATDDGAASDGGADDSGQQEPAAAALPKDADLATEELPITAERAIEIATETVGGGGDLVMVEIDHDDRTWEWELELVVDGTEHELDIDATTGEVTEHETDADDDQDPVVDVTSPMAYAEAIEIALGQEPGRVSGWELDFDDGTVRYQIDIDRSEGGDVEVEVDVETGDVQIDD